MTLKEFCSKGGKERAKRLTAQQLSDIGRMGAEKARALGKLTGRPPKAK